jgi:hypothetical protein
MRRTALFAAVSSVLSLASLSQAAFTITSAPSLQAAPAGSGKFAYDFFAQNDQADASDGINLQAVKLVFTGTNGTKVFFSIFDNGDGTFGADTYNFGAGTSGTNVTDPGSSNLRIGNRAAGSHAFPNVPGDSDSPVTAADAANGMGSFTADYAVLSAAQSVPTPTPPGARFARLVFNSATPTGTLVTSLAGEVGVASTQTYQIGTTTPTNPTTPTDVVTITPSSVTVDVAPAGLESFGPVVVLGTNNLTVGAIDPKIADNISISGTGVNRTISGSGFTYGDIGVYTIGFSSGSTTSTFTLTVVPEPTTLAALGAASLGLIRRRK